MNDQTGGALLAIAGVLAVVMAVKGSWNEVWGALTNKPTSKHASSAASFSTDPGSVLIDSGGSGTGSPGAAPVPLHRAVPV